MQHLTLDEEETEEEEERHFAILQYIPCSLHTDKLIRFHLQAY